METDRKEVEKIFDAAIQLENAEERDDFVLEACAENHRLLSRVQKLLRNHYKSSFLDVPVFDPSIALDDSPISEAPGSVIGRYKLLEQIGEGGMAVVYMAEQQEPIRRKVALKIIKVGMDTKQVIARFEAERQALAMMDHPNIARVLDAGASGTGRPYFVMDLVPGVCITEYCNQNQLTIKERLTLFIQVCNAVQHAHQKGIIHRDIKPSNIMVTLHDGKPIPKVIDFGIAKATNQRLTEKTLFTRFAHIIGTPTYMSPEQAELTDLDVDTRTDVYSLGVLLYELLTGTTPFGEEQLREAGFLQMQKIICEAEPTKPSTKLSTMGKALTDVAKLYGSSPEQMPRLIRGDLDWIVMKSLEKDRNHRYGTASGLALDVRRHLANEPVLARAPKAVYRFKKFLRRHQYQTIAALAIAILAASVIIVLSMLNRKRLELAETESLAHSGILARARSSLSSRDFPTALKEVESILGSQYVGPEAQLLYAAIHVEGQEPNVATVILEDLLDEAPEIAVAAHALLARIYWEGEGGGADRLAKANEHRQKAQELDPNTAEAHFLRAMTAFTIKEKLDMLDRALALDPGHYESLRLRALTYYASRKYQRMKEDARVMVAMRRLDPLGHSLQATALCELGDYEGAIENYDKAIKLISGQDSEYVELNVQRFQALMWMEEHDRVVAEARECLRMAPDETALHFSVLCALTALGRYEEATSLFRKVTDSNHTARAELRDRLMKHVFEMLHAGRMWHPQGGRPAGPAFLPMIEAEETYRHLSAKGRRLIKDGFGGQWSPDGSRLGVSLGVLGYSGLALFDPAKKETELLIVPGKDPRWSPDGKYVAFVRDCEMLRLTELTGAERRSQIRSYRDEEIWLMNSDGTRPRRLARGGWPSWTRDSKHLYYQSRVDGMLYSISVDDTQAQPKPVFASSCDHPSTSLDGHHVAYVEGGAFRVTDLASKSCIAEWSAPLQIWGGNWSWDEREFSLGGVNRTEDRTGLWIYDLDSKDASKVLSGQITYASWSPDGTQLLFCLGPPYFEIWVADLDPNMSTVETLGPGLTLEQHYQQMVSFYSRRIEADPENTVSYSHRAQYHGLLQNDAKRDTDITIAEALANGQGNSAFRFGAPTNLGSGLNTPGFESIVGVSGDDLSFYFIRLQGDWSKDLWVSTRATKHDSWGAAAYLGSLNNISTTAASIGPLATPTTADGLECYYAARLPGGYGEIDIWSMTRETIDGPWSPLVNLGPVVNTQSDEHLACVSPDGLELFFGGYSREHTRPGGFGHSDLWVTRRATRADPWTDPVNLGSSINSSAVDAHPSISPDGLLLFFDSNRPGGFGALDLYVMRRATLSDAWSEPVNLGPLVNTAAHEECARISADGSMLYWDSDRPGGYGGNDLWQAPITGLGSIFRENKRSQSTQQLDADDSP